MLSLQLAVGVAVLAAPASAPVDDPTLRDVLLEMARNDQESAHAVEASRPGDPGDAQVLQRSRDVHRRNEALIRSIIAEYGWPGRKRVGADGSRSAWLVVQHMDEDPAFQRRCLTLLEQAFKNGDADPENVAYLTDRVLNNEGKRQRYGTQGAGALSPEDEARFDAARKAIGLEPWRKFIERTRRALRPR